jgi:heptosyltransferase-3
MSTGERPPRTALISCLRLLGDVVLSLPLLDMLHQAHPGCAVDYLVPAGMGDFLRCDPRVRRVIEHRRGGPSYLRQILMRYDWAFGTNGSDRSVISVAAAGFRKRIAQVDPALPLQERWKRLALTHPTEMPGGKAVIKWTVHLARAAGLHPTRCRATVHWTPQHAERVTALLRESEADAGHFVWHPFSRYPYKEWDLGRVAEASDHLAATHALRPIWTGSGSERDRSMLAEAAARCRHAPVLCAGSLNLNEVTCLIARARLFLGVDTAVTHLAATTGTPIVALFGPTPTRGWSPWNNEQPIDYDFPDEPGSFRNGHISVLQDAEAFRREHSWQMDMQRPTEGMAAITVDQVVREAGHQLAQRSVHSAA